MTTFDREELRNQAEQLATLLDTLRPYPGAKLISFQQMQLIAAMTDDQNLIDIVRHADPQKTLFWELDGEYVEQRVEIGEYPLS